MGYSHDGTAADYAQAAANRVGDELSRLKLRVRAIEAILGDLGVLKPIRPQGWSPIAESTRSFQQELREYEQAMVRYERAKDNR